MCAYGANCRMTGRILYLAFPTSRLYHTFASVWCLDLQIAKVLKKSRNLFACSPAPSITQVAQCFLRSSQLAEVPLGRPPLTTLPSMIDLLLPSALHYQPVMAFCRRARRGHKYVFGSSGTSCKSSLPIQWKTSEIDIGVVEVAVWLSRPTLSSLKSCSAGNPNAFYNDSTLFFLYNDLAFGFSGTLIQIFWFSYFLRRSQLAEIISSQQMNINLDWGSKITSN